MERENAKILSTADHDININTAFLLFLVEFFYESSLFSILNNIYQHENTEITCWIELFFI